MDVGVEIGPYKVIEHIGRGGMADVWSARDQRLSRMVAVKTIAHGLSQDVDPVGMFKQEAQTIAQLEHPNILPIYDFGDYEGQLYIVMRYVAGGSLEDILRRGGMQVNDALRLGQAVAEALDYAHSNKVIHLDLKPPNVLLDSHQSPYLADFGLATVLDVEGKAVNPGSGTLLYMAPEQLTAEIIDHRADIYSFAIMMFHILTGELPFDATVPLALKQLQFQEEMPDIDEIRSDLPPQFTDILRSGTAQDPKQRPNTLMDIIREMQEALMMVTGAGFGLEGVVDDRFVVSDLDLNEMLTEPIPGGGLDAEILEAIDIYSRARHNWAGGNGRFLLGVTNFMVMNGYYMNAEQHKLQLDEAGRQMILRGALEYNIEVDYWWDQLDDDNRRWVSLHALRSGNAPARVRALYRLETLPDSESPQIPKLVAQALQIETDQEARIAALQVLGTRAKLMTEKSEYDVKTEYRGRMLTTMTRFGIQVNPPSVWQEVIYTPEIDLLVAEIALDYGMPKVAEYAARIVGRIRSRTAVRYIANQQREGRSKALRALALVRDEAPSLPPVVSRTGRLYAWATNTWLRMTDRPLSLVFRYLMAVIGGWLAMGFHVYSVFRSQAIFTQQRWANAIAIGLIFGVIVAFVALFSDEFTTRLRNFWAWWMRAIFSLITGMLWGAFAWWAWQWFFLNRQPSAELVLFGGFGLALGYMLTSLLRLRSYIAIPLTALLTYIPIFISFKIGHVFKEVWVVSDLANWGFTVFWKDTPLHPFGFLNFDFEALLYYSKFLDDGTFVESEQIRTVAIPFVLLVVVGGYFPSLMRDVMAFIKMIAPKRRGVADVPLHLPTVPSVPDVLPADEPAPAFADMKTELDFDLGAAIDKSDLYPATELDVNVDDVSVGKTEYDPNRGVAEETFKTEVDVNLGQFGDLKPADPLTLKTEIDVDLGLAEKPDSQGSRRFGDSRVEKPSEADSLYELKTEVDAGAALRDIDENVSKASRRFGDSRINASDEAKNESAEDEDSEE